MVLSSSPLEHHGRDLQIQRSLSQALLSCMCRYGLARGLATTVFYLAKHYAGGMLGWGPKYQLVVVQENSAKGLQQVRMPL